MDDTAASNTAPSALLTPEEEEAELAKAKALLKEDKFEEASDTLGTILERRAGIEGQLSPTLTELYYLYGTAMIGLAKKQSVNLLSAMVQRIVRKKTGEAEDAEEDDDDDDEEETINDAEETLQIAWETLDIARTLLEKDQTKPLQLADVHMKLAEVHEESDNIADAIGEYQRALDLRREHLEPDSRLLAEVYSCLAFDYSLEKRYTDAFTAYTHAAECIEKRIATLEEQAAAASGDKGKGKTDAAAPAATEEIAELREILADVRERIDNMKHVDAEERAVKDAKAMFSPPSAQSVSLSTKKPAEAPKVAAQPVHHLGVFGRSKKIPFPSASSSTSTTTPSEPSSNGSGKRKRTDEESASNQDAPSSVTTSGSLGVPSDRTAGEAGDSADKSGGEVSLKKARTEHHEGQQGQ